MSAQEQGPELPFTESIKRNARRNDPQTSKVAAVVIDAQLGKIQREVLAAYEELGPMTARTCERLDRFGCYGFSTVRKRISELAEKGALVAVGVDTTHRAPATVYAIQEPCA